jgi:hypothetical protein
MNSGMGSRIIPELGLDRSFKKSEVRIGSGGSSEGSEVVSSMDDNSSGSTKTEGYNWQKVGMVLVCYTAICPVNQ